MLLIFYDLHMQHKLKNLPENCVGIENRFLLTRLCTLVKFICCGKIDTVILTIYLKLLSLEFCSINKKKKYRITTDLFYVHNTTAELLFFPSFLFALFSNFIIGNDLVLRMFIYIQKIKYKRTDKTCIDMTASLRNTYVNKTYGNKNSFRVIFSKICFCVFQVY